MTEAPAAERGLTTVRGMLEKMKSQIEAALPRHMTPDRLIRTAMTSVQKNPKLLECHPVTLIGAIVQCAQLGLEPDDGTGKAYLIPFWNNKKGRLEAQFMAGYRGLVDLARRSGQITRFDARVVKEGDTFDYEFGLQPKLVHKPSTLPERMKQATTYVYAVGFFKDGGEPQFDVMTIAEVEAIRKRSKAKDSGPWETDYDEMAKKTVVRRISKMLPSSPELQQAVTLDERADRGLPQDLGLLVDPTETGTPNPEEEAKVPQRASEIAAPESGAPSPLLVGIAERLKIRELTKQHNISEKTLATYLQDQYGIKDTAHLQSKDYAGLVKWISEEPEIPFGKK